MCMKNPVRIESKDVPKYAYKVYEGFIDNVSVELFTYFQHIKHMRNKFNKSNFKKRSHKTVIHCHSALHLGRISVFVNKKDAVKFCNNRFMEHDGSDFQCQVWKVVVKQTTKYAYKGKFTGETLAVDQVKPIKRVI